MNTVIKGKNIHILKNRELLGEGIIIIEKGLTNWWKFYKGINPSGSPKGFSTLIETRTNYKEKTKDGWYLCELNHLNNIDKSLVESNIGTHYITNRLRGIDIRVSSDIYLKVILITLRKGYKKKELIQVINSLIINKEASFNGWNFKVN